MSDHQDNAGPVVIVVPGDRGERRQQAPSDHPWRIAIDLIDRGVITAEEARDEIVFEHRSMQRRSISAVQRLMAEASSRGEDTVRIVELNTAMAMAPMRGMSDL